MANPCRIKVLMNPLGLVVLFLFLFSACSDDDVDYGYGEYKVDIVTYLAPNSFLLDNGKTAYNVEPKTSREYEEGDRIWLHYSFLPDIKSGYDFAIRVNGSSKITKSKLLPVKADTIGDFKNDPIQFESAWIGSHYLNMQFYMDFKSEPHQIALITDSKKLKNDSIWIYFRHDINNDPPGYANHVIASFDLKELLGEPQHNKVLFVNFNTSNYGDKMLELKY